MINKVKYIVDKTYLIHSVDSLRLAEQINQEAKKRNVICNVLIEVNIAQEESKFGVTKEELPNLLRQIRDLKNVSKILKTQTQSRISITGTVYGPENQIISKNRAQYTVLRTRLPEGLRKQTASHEMDSRTVY